MQSRRYISLIVSVLLIIALLIIFTDPWSTLRNEGKRIILSDPSQVDRISLSGRYDSVLLVRQHNQWLLQGTESVNPVAVQNLLFSAERLQINSITMEAGDWKGADAKRVKFMRGGRTLLEYEFVARNGKYLVRIPGSDRGFYVTVSGYGDENLEKIYSSLADHYRVHVLMELLPSEISMIQVELGSGQAYRFTQDPDGAINYEPLNQLTFSPSGLPMEHPVKLLFSYFTSLRYEQLTGIQAITLTRTGSEKKRIAKLTIESHGGEKHTLQVFPWSEEPGDEPHMFQALVVHNDDPEAVLINYIYLDVLMRHPSHYFAAGE